MPSIYGSPPPTPLEKNVDKMNKLLSEVQTVIIQSLEIKDESINREDADKIVLKLGKLKKRINKL